VPVAAQVARFLLVLYHHYFPASSNIHYFSIDFSAGNIRSSYSYIIAILRQKHLIKGYFIPLFVLTKQFLNSDQASFRDLVLLPSCLYNCKFHNLDTTRNFTKKQAFVILKDNMMQTKIIERYFFFGLMLATFIFTFFIFKPFWVVLFLGLSFSIVLYPIYEWQHNKGVPRWVASLLTVVLFVVVVCGPLLGVGTIVFKQSQNLYYSITSNYQAGALLSSLEDNVNKVLPEGVNFNINQKIAEFVSYLSDNIANIFTATVSAGFSFVLILLIIFYFLKDGREWRRAIVILSPLDDKDDEMIISRLAQAVNGVIKGSLLIAVIQGTLLGLGFWFFGISNAALWGVVAAITSLIPTLGTSLVSVPAILFLFATGNTGSAIGLLIWAGAMVGTIDNFLGPIIVSKRVNVSSLLILFSVLGGISLLGPVGILVGPLTISLLYTLISIYRNELKKNATI